MADILVEKRLQNYTALFPMFLSPRASIWADHNLLHEKILTAKCFRGAEGHKSLLRAYESGSERMSLIAFATNKGLYGQSDYQPCCSLPRLYDTSSYYI